MSNLASLRSIRPGRGGLRLGRGGFRAGRGGLRLGRGSFRAGRGSATLAGLLMGLVGVSAPAGAPLVPSVDLAPAPGSILAPVAGSQVGWLDLDAPRPRIVARVTPPAQVADLAPAGDGSAVLAVNSPFGGVATKGGDLLLLDLATGSLSALVARVDADESLEAPTWSASRGLLFERADLRRSPASLNQGHYASRIEHADADGSGRTLLVEDARQPAFSPDGNQLAYVRNGAPSQTALVVRSSDGGDEREIIPAGRFSDVAYPRWSPEGSRVAVMAPSAPPATAATTWRQPDGLRFGPDVTYAHGVPWDLWVVSADGSGLARLAALAGDDASVCWSPDGSQLFVYGGAGSFLVDALTGQSASQLHLVGYGAAIWLTPSPT